jgi:glycosyltransferase involved in cell wall biosynthesis
MYKVSVIVPVYGTEAYIEQCARSLMEQTLDEVEYIFVNDASPDRAEKVLRRTLEDYPQRKSQVTILNHPTNLGAAKAREDGMRAARGEYLIHCDSDDWVERDMYEVLYRKAKAEDLDIVISAFTEEGPVPRKVEQPMGSDPVREIVKSPVKCSLFNKLVRGSIVRDNDMRYPAHHMMEDYAICVQMFYHARSVGYVDKSLYHYRIVSDSICHQESEQSHMKRWREAFANVRLVDKFLADQGKSAYYASELLMAKLNVRGFLWPLLAKGTKYYTEWHDTFPELNRKFVTSKYMSARMKLVFLITYLRGYAYYCKLKK